MYIGIYIITLKFVDIEVKPSTFDAVIAKCAPFSGV
jgi:hypothetical protein